jgi:tetratricopeptide (TPR) repeat protein
VPEKSESEERAGELLKEATQKKNNDDWNGAINCLREAYKQIAQTKISYPIETYLRLPLYLQQAGRYTESFDEFEKLLKNLPAKIAKEFSHISKQEQDGLIAMEASVIYDKMRLASQRENQFTYSVYYQILSNANRAVGLKLQEREKELDRFMAPEFWAKSIEGLLKKTKNQTLSEVLVDKCMIFSRTCTSRGLKTLDADIKNLLKTP